MRLSCSRGQATIEWLIATALVALLAFQLHLLTFAPLRRVYRWVADCVTSDRCGPL